MTLRLKTFKAYEPEQQKKRVMRFYTETYMKTLLPHATVIPPPVSSEMRHCCIIRKR